MALIKPTLTQITDRLNMNLTSKLCNGEPLRGQSVIRVISQVVGFAIWALYEFSDRLGRTPATATGQFLTDWGNSCDISPNPATCATGTITVNGTGTIPAGTVLTRCDGVTYTTDAEAVVGVDPITITAEVCGADGNAPAGTVLSINGVVPGIDSQAVVATTALVGGADEEDEDTFRSRVISCASRRCRTGTASDYDFWAKTYNGVTRTFVQDRANGCGTVKVYFTMDDVYLNGIPATGDIVNVQNIINENKPLGVCVTVCAPEPVTVDVTLKVGYSTTTERLQIASALEDLFKIAGPGNFGLSDIYVAIDAVYDRNFEVTSPTSSFTIGSGQIPVLGTITYQAL